MVMATTTDRTCECGVSMKLKNPANVHIHQRSTFHRNAMVIKSLLKVPGMSYAEIGRQLGITRERVRQIAKTLDESNIPEANIKYRRRVAEKARVQRWAEKERHEGLIGELEKECLKRGLDLELVPRIAADEGRLSGYNRFSKRYVLINGRRCYISRMYPIGKYFGISPAGDASADSEFMIYCYPEKDLWMVMPREVAPWKAGTQFMADDPDPCGKGMTHNKRHDWREYFDRWDLLLDES